MGCYDSVMVPCPACGAKEEFQSKSGECLMGCYTLENCPQEVLYDINRHSPYTCKCGCKFQVKTERVIRVAGVEIVKKGNR